MLILNILQHFIYRPHHDFPERCTQRCKRFCKTIGTIRREGKSR
ncbi:MAG: hypothetical protein GC136_03580 [Alphaproteobacteria bacterium]|nr:hypothetical protein [Alphaproteobacteria bacterium]